MEDERMELEMKRVLVTKATIHQIHHKMPLKDKKTTDPNILTSASTLT
jgi:hypothetical protein